MFSVIRGLESGFNKYFLWFVLVIMDWYIRDMRLEFFFLDVLGSGNS